MEFSPQNIDSLLLSILNKVSSIQYSKIDYDANFDDIELDSLGLTQIIVQLEETTGVEIDPLVIDKLAVETNVSGFLKTVRQYYLSLENKV